MVGFVHVEQQGFPETVSCSAGKDNDPNESDLLIAVANSTVARG